MIENTTIAPRVNGTGLDASAGDAQQMEGGIVFGLPQVEVHVVRSSEDPSGAGECGFRFGSRM
jgi:hypothetical protein